MKKTKNLFPMAVLLAATTMLTVSCSDDDEDNNPIASAPTQTAEVLIVHASPDAPGVDILVDGAGPAVSNLEFPSNTGYVALTAGTRNVKVNVTGTSTTVIDADVVLDANASYTVFAANQVSAIEPVVLVDDLTAPAAGMAHVRFVHLSPDAPPVDVALAGGGAVVFGNVAFKAFDSFTPLMAGAYDLEVRLAGTSTVVLPLPGIALEAGKIYTVFARGLVSGTASQSLGAEIIVNK